MEQEELALAMALSLATAEADGELPGLAEDKWEAEDHKRQDLRRHADAERIQAEEGQRRSPPPAAVSELLESRRRRSFKEHASSEARFSEEESLREVALRVDRARSSAEEKHSAEAKTVPGQQRSRVGPLAPLPSLGSPSGVLSDRVEDALEESRRHLSATRELTSELREQVDAAEVERRAAHMREQQRAIVAQKRREREARAAQRRDGQQASEEAKEARAQTASEAKGEDARERETSRRRAVMSMALASRLKEELTSSDGGRLGENQLSDLNRKVSQLEQSRQRSEQREKSLAAFLNRRL